VSQRSASTDRLTAIRTGVPQRPQLGPEVRLAGQFQGSGFVDPQWLIERRGRFLQVSELFYRITEEIDGRRTLDEISARVTANTDWYVTSEDLGKILTRKLIPLGVVSSGHPSAVPHLEDPTRSVLQVRGRRRLLGPVQLEAMTRVLQIAYSPPIMVPALILVALAHGWLYLVHGLTDSLRLALYTPGGLLLVVGLVLLSGLVHEFGHAAALRYSGGKPRSMGAGFYLVFPTFYTDTSDAYRLSRWSRLRTDLGGIYFHLLFALAVVVAYFITGHEPLLAVVGLINADMLYQLTPLVRLDGYWALTDLAGIPDFFSQTRPFLRRSLAIRQGGSELPALRRHAAVFFALYILLSFPAIAVFLILFLTRLPETAKVSFAALHYQTEIWARAADAGSFLGLGAVTTQIALLLLFLAAVLYMLFNLGRSQVKSLWKWSRPSALRRGAAAAVLCLSMALLAVFWAPAFWKTSPAGVTPPAGTNVFSVDSRSHVLGDVTYTQTPPVGGDHAPLWQNCGFYDATIRDETAVHSLEHGAVWITYRPELPHAQLSVLRRLSEQQNYVLVSPFRSLPSPVVASAWAHQIRLHSAGDHRLRRFIDAFRLSGDAPEPGGGCTGGVGSPK
jgi:putative peptide zinc metalloprotease protein